MAPLPFKDPRNPWLKYQVEGYGEALGLHTEEEMAEDGFGAYWMGRLRGLSLITRDLPLLDLHELGRLNIYERIGDTWDWVASRLERNLDATTGSPRATKDTLAVDDGAQADQHP
nr:hypothetical protein [Tanacetum cinerariifolium]